jgi:hypothetical protein
MHNIGCIRNPSVLLPLSLVDGPSDDHAVDAPRMVEGESLDDVAAPIVTDGVEASRPSIVVRASRSTAISRLLACE